MCWKELCSCFTPPIDHGDGHPDNLHHVGSKMSSAAAVEPQKGKLPPANGENQKVSAQTLVNGTGDGSSIKHNAAGQPPKAIDSGDIKSHFHSSAAEGVIAAKNGAKVERAEPEDSIRNTNKSSAAYNSEEDGASNDFTKIAKSSHEKAPAKAKTEGVYYQSLERDEEDKVEKKAQKWRGTS